MIKKIFGCSMGVLTLVILAAMILSFFIVYSKHNPEPEEIVIRERYKPIVHEGDYIQPRPIILDNCISQTKRNE